MCETQVSYKASVHEEALARLHFLVEQRRRVGLLLGSTDAGKSRLLGTFAGAMRRSGRQAILVSLLGIDADEFLRKVTAQLGAATDIATAGPHRKLWQRLSDRLIANRFDQQDTVLLLDDVDMAQTDVLRQVVRLAQFDAQRETRLTLIAAADRSRLDKLGERLIDLVALSIDLDGWELDAPLRHYDRAQHGTTADRSIAARHA